MIMTTSTAHISSTIQQNKHTIAESCERVNKLNINLTWLESTFLSKLRHTDTWDQH